MPPQPREPEPNVDGRCCVAPGCGKRSAKTWYVCDTIQVDGAGRDGQRRWLCAGETGSAHRNVRTKERGWQKYAAKEPLPLVPAVAMGNGLISREDVRCGPCEFVVRPPTWRPGMYMSLIIADEKTSDNWRDWHQATDARLVCLCFRATTEPAQHVGFSAFERQISAPPSAHRSYGDGDLAIDMAPGGGIFRLHVHAWDVAKDGEAGDIGWVPSELPCNPVKDFALSSKMRKPLNVLARFFDGESGDLVAQGGLRGVMAPNGGERELCGPRVGPCPWNEKASATPIRRSSPNRKRTASVSARSACSRVTFVDVVD